MKSKLILFFFITFLFSLTFISAVPFQVNVNTVEGLQIFYPHFEYVKQNSNFNLHIHVSNISNGFPLNNTQVNCHLHLYDVSGNHTFESGILNKDDNKFDHEIHISSGNFSKLGTHAFYIWCNNSVLGGSVRGTFEVTKTGEKLETSEALIYLIVLMASVSLFVLCLWGAIKTVWKNPRNDENKIIDISYLKYVKISLCFLSYALLIWITNIMVLITNNLLNSSVAFTFFKVVYTILISMFYPIILGVLFVIAMNILLDKKFKRLLERGIFPDG